MQFEKNKEKLHKITMKSFMTFLKTFTRRMTFNATLSKERKASKVKSYPVYLVYVITFWKF